VAELTVPEHACSCCSRSRAGPFWRTVRCMPPPSAAGDLPGPQRRFTSLRTLLAGSQACTKSGPGSCVLWTPGGSCGQLLPRKRTARRSRIFTRASQEASSCFRSGHTAAPWPGCLPRCPRTTHPPPHSQQPERPVMGCLCDHGQKLRGHPERRLRERKTPRPTVTLGQERGSWPGTTPTGQPPRWTRCCCCERR
jgi:hypothetical protein